jgi:preprotein translocase subunit SecD
MSCRTAMRAAGLLVSWALAAGIAAGGEQPKEHQAGFYLIAAEAPSAGALPTPGSGQQVARYDQKFLRESERGAPTYLLLPKHPNVTLRLAAPPAIAKGPNGFAELRLELTKEAAGDLEKLSREHLGETVSLMIDGEVVTRHKIRSVISGGEFRLSRCTDNACQYILGRLTAER